MIQWRSFWVGMSLYIKKKAEHSEDDVMKSSTSALHVCMVTLAQDNHRTNRRRVDQLQIVMQLIIFPV